QPVTPTPVAAPAATAPAKKVFETQARALTSATLMAGQARIKLWGIDDVQVGDPAVNLKGRTVLDNIIAARKISCELKSPDPNDVRAQCVNAEDQDLSLYMLQQGFATVDRGAVYGTVFEDPYIQAETRAQEKKLGIWAGSGGGAQSGRADDG